MLKPPPPSYFLSIYMRVKEIGFIGQEERRLDNHLRLVNQMIIYISQEIGFTVSIYYVTVIVTAMIIG